MRLLKREKLRNIREKRITLSEIEICWRLQCHFKSLFVVLYNIYYHLRWDDCFKWSIKCSSRWYFSCTLLDYVSLSVNITFYDLSTTYALKKDQLQEIGSQWREKKRQLPGRLHCFSNKIYIKQLNTTQWW